MPNRVIALGFFDGVHLGHRALLCQTAALAHSLGAQATAITFDPHPDALLFGQAQNLLTTLKDRQELMQRLCHIDELIVLPFDEAMRTRPPEVFVHDILIEQLHAVHVVCGENFRFGYRGQGDLQSLRSICAQYQIGCSILPPVLYRGEIICSTRIRTLLQQGQLALANELLGHPYCLTGQVIHGQHLGHTLGFPTANFAFPRELLPPQFGVYVTQAQLNDVHYPAVTNLGLRPTVSSHEIFVESFLLGFDGDLYGQSFRLDFLDFLRPEQKFSSLSQLKQQIDLDRKQAIAYFSS